MDGSSTGPEATCARKRRVMRLMRSHEGERGEREGRERERVNMKAEAKKRALCWVLWVSEPADWHDLLGAKGKRHITYHIRLRFNSTFINI